MSAPAKKLGVFLMVIGLVITAAGLRILIGEEGKQTASPTGNQSSDVSIHSRAYKEAFLAGATFWTCKQVCPDLNERHVKAAIFNRIRNERIGATVKEVEAAFEAGAQAEGETFSVNPTPAPETGAPTSKP